MEGPYYTFAKKKNKKKSDGEPMIMNLKLLILDLDCYTET